MKTDKQPYTVGRAVKTVTLWLVVGLVLVGSCIPTGAQARASVPAGPEAPAVSPEQSFPLPIPQKVSPIGSSETGAVSELQATVAMEMIPDTGTADRTSVYNGDMVTYTLVLTNESAVPITYFSLYDLLPQDTLDNITCVSTAPVCELIVEQEVFPEPSGGTVVVTATRQIKWEVLTPLPPQGRFTVAFSGRLMGQPEGARFTNRAFVRYWLQGATQPGTASVELSLTAHVRVTPGTTSISTVPTWFSNDMGGTLSQDWGDFDRDGDLDLALGSSLGTTIYRNDGGVLQQIMDFMPDAQGQQRLSYGVRWADLIPEADHTLELVVVGDSADHTAHSEGINYIYQFDAAQQSFSTSEVFTTDLQLVRVAPGDYDGDGDIDLVASTNAINAPCTVALYRNDGTGHFTGTVTAAGPNQIECLSQAATAALGPGDYDNDGDLDLALGAFPSTLQLLVNDRNGAVFTATNPLATLKTIESGLEYIPYDLVWGDYNGDGYLDLAAAYPLQRETQVYQNQPSSGTLIATAESIRTSTFMTPLTVDWGDFNGDGRLDLAVADSRLKFYEYRSSAQAFSLISSLVPPLTTGQVWSIQGVELNEQHTLNLAMTNRDGPSRIFSILGPKLRPTSVPLGSGTFGQVLGNSVAWGDVDNDGDLDLLVGADALGVSSYLYLNQQGRFNSRVEIRASGFGPHAVAWGDVTGDGRLDMAIGTPSEVHIYFNGNTAGEPNQRFRMSHPAASVAWGDADDDGRLDLLVGQNGGPVTLYLNRGTQLSTTAIFTTSEIGQITSVAWGDDDQDYYLDFAVGAADQPLRVYRNNGDGRTFRLTWSSPAVVPALGLDWADYDRDGDLDLAVAGGGRVMIWENQGSTFGTAPVWQATLAASSVAWGDWDSDGYPDLAAGGTFSPTSVVYANLGSAPGVPQLAELWYGSSNLPVAGLAWGDMEGDGDLDLAVASAGGMGRTRAMADEAGLLPRSYVVRQTTAALAVEPSGVYTNILATPAHLYYPANSLTPLANTPPYVRVARPGTTGAAYFYSAAPVLTGPNHPTVTVQYQVYDHEADPLARTYFEYSLNGGSVWKTATAATSTVILTQTATTGATGTFIWNAAADRAIGDNARFRVRVVPNDAVGPVQRAVGIGVSPPFRVRSVDCVWPFGASIAYTPTTVVTAGQQIEFTGRVLLAEGFITYEWDFGDGTTGSGRVIKHSYGRGGTYTVTLAVHGPDCPPSVPSRPAYAFTVVTIPRGGRLYLPLVLRNRSIALVAQSELPETYPPVTLAAPPATTPVAVRFSVPQLQATTAAAGSNLLRITTSAQGFSHQPAVNRDGSRLAFWSTARTARNLDGSIEIFLADVQPNGTLSYTQLTSSTGSILVGFNLGPSIDDAGERVVFFSDRDLTGQNPDRNFEIFLADIGAGGIFTLTQLTITPKGINILPKISGGGRFVVFASDRDLTGSGGQVDGQTEIYRAELLSGGGTTFTRITTALANHPGSSDEPTISADGKRMAFTSEQDLTGENADGNREIFLAEVLPGGAITYTQITHSDLGVNEQPSLSGDGRWLAFISDRDLVAGQNTAHIRQVFMAELGTDPHSVSLSQLTTSSGAKSRPTISADGLRLAYLLNQQVQLYDAVEQTTLSGGTGSDNAYPSLSAGGDAVAFADSGQIYLRRYPLADLAVTKSGVPTMVAVGELVTYTLVVTNYGPSPATGVLLSDTLPAGFVSRLTSVSQDAYTDRDGTSNGFGGGAHTGTYWNTVRQTVQLTPTASSALVLLHLDEPAGATLFNDVSGAGNVAACAGTTCPLVTTGQFGNAVQLDGNNDQLNINSAPNLASRSFTVAFWARRLSTGTADVVVGQGAPATNVGLYIGFRSNNRFTCSFWGNDLDAPGSYMDTLWHHWACTYDAATRRRTIYRDGVMLTWDTATASYQGGGPLVVGNFPGLTDYFHGQLDEIAIFTRVLTATEVQLLSGGPVAPYNGYFDSRVLTDTLGGGRWSALGWVPYRPLGEPLPDEGIQETGYVTGNVNMTGTALLLHLDESSGTNAFQDTSGRSNNTYCLGTSCPIAGAPGAFGTALEFDGAIDYLYAPDNSTLDLSQFTVGLWVWPVMTTTGLYQTLLVKEDSYGYNVNYSLMLAKGSTKVNYDFLPAGQCGNLDAFVGGNGTQALQLNAWNHVMMTYDGANLIGYVNGQQDVIFPGVPAPCQNSFPLKLGREFSDDVQTPFKGRLDEVVILNRPLTADEVRDHYLRGLARLRFQVRTCATPDCTNGAFVGPDGTFRSYYTSLDDALVGPPELGLQNLAAGRYAQYRFALDADAYPQEFGVSRVTLSPQVTCQGQQTVTCTLGSVAAPLAVGQMLSLTLPTQIVDSYAAYLASTEVAGQRVVTNTVTVDAEESDHGPVGNNYAAVHTGLDFSILLGVTISGREAAAVDTPEIFTATVIPLNATPPISYTWSATGKPTAVYTSGQVSYVLSYTWSTPGVRVITVTADNPLHNVVTDVHTVTVVYKVDHLVVTSTSPTELEQLTAFTATVAPTSTNVTYLWDFGDGQTATSGPGTSTTVTHTYAQTGTYTAVVTATNLYNSLVQTITVEVLEAPITHLQLHSNSPLPLGNVAYVTATLTSGTNVTYTWDFGDGTPITTITPYYLAKTVPLTHTYVQTGTYTVVVTATNSRGSQTVSTNVVVTDVPIAGLTVINNSPTEYDDPTVLTATVTAGTNVHYTWAFGDGQFAAIQTLTFTNQVSLTHVFSTYFPLRVYPVVVTATNGTNSLTATTMVTVYRTCWAQLNGADYATVQAAIAAAASGDTVKVAGTCSRLNTTDGHSQVAYLTQPLTLQGGYTFTQWTSADPVANPTTLDAHGQGRGLYILGANGVTVSGLRFTGGYADYGGGLYALNATLTLSACQVFGNQATVYGGGLWLEGGVGTLRQSQVTTNTAVEGGGLYIKSNPATVDSLVVRGNSASTQGGGLYLFEANATVINTVLVDNQALTQGSGVSIYSGSPRFLHTTLARNSGNNGFYYNGAGSQVYLTNTILVSHTVGVVVSSGSAIVNGVLWAGNGTNTSGVVTVNNAVTGPPAFLADGYHIGLNSAARNRGVAAGVGVDLDGDRRDRTPDLGADELRTCWVRLNNDPTDYVDVQAAVDAATQPTDEVKVAGLCASLETRAGVTQVVYLSRTLRLQGGYTLTNWLTPEPVTNPTTLDALGGGRGLYIAGAITPTISGLHLVNGYAPQGGGVYIITATPTLTSMWLEGNVATGAGGGLFLNGGGLMLTQTLIYSNQASNGGGLYLQPTGVSGDLTSAGPVRLSDNTLLSNTATNNGGGLYLRLGWQTFMTGNQVLSNSATVGGGGLFLDTPGLPGSLLHLPLDEPARTDTWADLSGYGYHATCSGTSCPLPAQSGPFRYAAAFDGNDSLVSANLPLANASFTLAAWVKRDHAGGQDFFIGQGTTSSNQGLYFGFRDTNYFTCAFYANDLNTLTSETDLTWQQWVCTYDVTTHQRSLYRNGQLVSSDTASAYQGSGPLWIGMVPWSSQGFQGLLDEVQIYGRALGAAEVQRLYQLTQPPAVQVVGNTLNANRATRGGGLAMQAGAAAIVGNLFRDNSAALVDGGYGGGFWLEQAGALIEANTFTANASYRGGGGALLNSPAVLRSNWVMTNTALQDGGGLHFRGSAASLLGNRVLGNQAAGAGSGWGGGLYLYQSAAQLKNNVLAENVAAVVGGGVYLDSSAAQLWHTTLVSNTGTGIWMADTVAPVALTNTILVSHTAGVRGGSPGGVTMDGVLWFNTGTPTSGPVVVNHATSGAPAFMADGYHITHDSAARDVGVTGLSFDLDGDPRPVGVGYDLGADEIRTCFAKLNDAPTLYEEVQLAVDASTDVNDVVKLAGYCRGVSVRDGLTQTAYLSKTLTLQGGWNLDFTVRDPTLYPTTLDAGGNRRVLYITGAITPTVMDLNLTGGNAANLGGDPGGEGSGGGIYVVTATATISGCRIYGNQAVYGGGIFLLRSNARLIGNTVTENRADLFGGGIEIDYGDFAELRGNIVLSNAVGSAACSSQFCGGGGIYIFKTTAIALTNTVITSNTTQVEGGGLYLDTSMVTARNTVLRYNQADIGGGLTVYSTTAWMTNTLIADNQATDHASGVEATAATLAMRHTTVARNTGGDGSGFYVADDLGRYSLVTLTNTILVSQTVGITVTAGSAATLNGVLWFGNDVNSGGAGTLNITQALTGAPAFVDPAGGDYHIQGTSLARDAGLLGPADTDLDGNPRPQGKAPDLGAYEFQAALTLAKRQNPTAVQAGGLLTYTLTYTATGTRPSLGVVLSDTTPAHTTFYAATPTPVSAPAVGAGGSVVWSLGDLTPLATGAVTLVVRVNTPLTRGLVLTNSALLTDTQGLADTALLTNAVQTSHALTLTKWASASPVPAAGPLTYTLAYTITGNEPAFGAVMSDTLPAYTTFVTATGGLGLLATAPVRWALGDLLLPESGLTQAIGTLTLVVQVQAVPNGTLLTNTAILSDTSGQSAARTITTPIQSTHTLSVTKSASSAVVQAGDQLTYTIAYTVTGNELALNPRLADTLPAEVTLVSCAGAPCGAVGRTVTWTLGTLTPTTTGLVTAVVQVPSLLNGTPLTNAVTFTDTLGGSAAYSITTVVQSSHSLSVTKLGPPTFIPGNAIAYTLLYTVTGNEPAMGATLSDTVPANTTYVGCSGGLSCSRSGSLVTWTLGALTPTLAAPTSGTARLTVTIASPLDNGTLITNSVSLTDTAGLSAADTSTGEVTSQPLLELLKTSVSAGGAPLIPGEWLTYTLRITNTGTARAAVTITDTIPTFTIYVAGSISGGDSRTVNLPLLNWTINNLNSGTAAQLSFAVVVTTPLTHATAIYNLATATGVNGTGSYQVTVAAQDDLTDTVTASHALTLTKSAAPSVAQPGTFLTYTIAYTVTGTEPVYGVVVSDTTPLSTTYVSATPAPTSAPGVGSSGTVRWQRGNLLPPASGQTQATGVLTWVVQVANLPPAGVPLTNTVIITDAAGQSATRVITTPLQSTHTLTVAKRSAPALIYPGSLLTYTLVYTVAGNESAPGVVVSDTVPANTTYQSCAGGLTCSGPAVGSGGLVTWNLGNVAPGSGAVTLTVRVVASPPAGVPLTNTVAISDTSGLSGTYRLTTTLQSQHTLWLVKQGPPTVGAGNLLTYTLAYSVTGNQNATDARISDTIPLNTIYQNCAGGTSCIQSGGLVTWSLGTLTPSAAGVVTLTVQTTVPLAQGTIITNVSSFTDTDGLSVGAQVTTTVISSHTLAVRKAVAPATVQPGGTLTYTIAYTVTGTEVAPDVTLSDTLPVSTTSPSCTPACTITGNGVVTTVTWSLGTLTPVASGLVTLTVLVDTTVPSGTTIVNTISITDTTGAASSDTVNTWVQGSTRTRRILGLELSAPRYGIKVEYRRWGRTR